MQEKIKNMSKTKLILHIVALFSIMFIGDLLNSIPFDILFSIVDVPYRWIYNVRSIGAIVVTYTCFQLYTKKFFNARMEDFRIGLPKINICDIIYALFLPGSVLVFFSIIGTPIFNDTMAPNAIFTIIIAASSRALKAGILEEILFRGYIMKLLELRWNKYIAIILPSFIFSLLHIFSMNQIDILSLLLLICAGTLVGIMFSIIAYKNNSVWGSSFVHTIWNTVMISNIVHIFNGTKSTDIAIYSILLPSDNVLLTGGEFGVESSLVAIIAYAIICVFVLCQLKRHKNPN